MEILGRADGRRADELRPVTMEPGFVRTATGSCLITCGGTRVICTVSAEAGVPPFLSGKGSGWLTAEYAMLPASTGRRKQRDYLKRDGRSVEIQRLIGRTLRQSVDLNRLGERTLTVDCDVLEADGGTRAAAITGAFVALVQTIDALIAQGRLKESPIVKQVAAVSCGLVADIPCLDLCYAEDSAAQVDLNLVMDGTGGCIEVQGTGEKRACTMEELQTLLALAQRGIERLVELQRQALGEAAALIAPKPKLVAATNNPHKVRELQKLLGERYDILSDCSIEVEETADTFEGNAALKAEALLAATGLSSVADDSGLEVDALLGQPGVRSARYCGQHGNDEANNDLLLQNLANVAAPRTARFVSAIALARPGKPTLIVRGTCEGSILFERHGTGGFGYDSLFLPAGGEKSFAEITEEEKNAVSHRAQAVAKLLEALNNE
ncbi:MAG: ribonuclease PH [Clostridia bacterium]|nr:ribonuclease PH [Clostridia bacterium]